MAVRNILVAYNGTPSSDAALSAAAFMGNKYDAHVTGLMATVSRIDIVGRPWLPDAIQKTILDLDREHMKDMEARFREKMAGELPDEKLHWIAQRGEADATVSDYAHMYDLTVVGRHDAVLGDERLELHPDRIALKSGRPVLVIPQTWSQPLFHEHALLAWDGNRSATRALSDAMQLLELKQLVTVLTVKAKGVGRALKGINVETVLSRHGVATDVVSMKQNGRHVSDIILEECANRKAGLLVMGAYEHSKFREDLLGGVTNTVLRECPIPVLLSH
ncbi:universal stress protein [Hoeflea sp. TYP-13]|uniref:universal stress protein n=1 Tax=Hoeflea sp. TYP-13 TaxID=3230023 RepID=UPI0034C6931B